MVDQGPILQRPAHLFLNIIEIEANVVVADMIDNSSFSRKHAMF